MPSCYCEAINGARKVLLDYYAPTRKFPTLDERLDPRQSWPLQEYLRIADD